ncbi:Damaged dna-binding 2, putative isoform 2 [Hibiscus syriacus]|uniref:Damaged dna-binding 2, putative isoform 2 n=1 Tax=Hibiscus syriacus TaxID=106335 RepID=A0A6A3D0R0_HIBSY|nr:uncharacterized protein LOC120201260 [Hibiscus syriacus]XP_039057841.1 uncharacterized protein LOC120201260 [Hibiscus syriacus]KAE8735303.1 Damaged dna-binding 2, putative isoform 2 [Hibiscus syriacus]
MNDESCSMRSSGFIHGMERISVHDSAEDPGWLSSEDDGEDDDLGSSSSSSIGRNSDVSGESSAEGEDSAEAEVESQLKEPLDSMDALVDALPMRRGISNFYTGRSKSYTSLADAAAAPSVKDFAKPEDPYNRKRKNLLAHGSFLGKNRNRSAMALRAIASTSDFNSISSSPSSSGLPPLHPQHKKSTAIRSSSLTSRPIPPCRSFSLSDLQYADASTPHTAGLAVHSGNNDNKPC